MELQFNNAKGEKLSAKLELPTSKPKAFALFAHCFTCSKDIAAASRISRALTHHGFGVLRFDFTGLGNSEGDFANTNFSSNVEDLVCAADELRRSHQAPSIIIGHSLGGAAVLAAAPRIEEVKAVCTIAAPSNPDHVSHLFEGDIEKIQADGEAEVNLAGRKFKIKKQFLEDISHNSLEKTVGGLHRALLIFHSPVDNLVSIDHAKNIYNWAKHPKSFVSLDHADHLLTKSIDSEYVAATLAAWATRYIGFFSKPVSQPGAQEGEVLVQERDGKFAQDIYAGKHVLSADEPPSVGGANTGPTPYDLLLAGLGACSSMTMRMYARHKNFPVDKISVRLKHEKIHARDCEECETKVGKIDKIQKWIRIEGDLTEEQRQKVLEISEKCPVHRTLHSENIIETKWEGQ